MEKITSRKNPLAVHIKKLGTSRSYRQEQGEFLCDGIKLLEEAVMSNIGIISVLTASNVPFPLSMDTRVYYTDRGIIDYLSPLKNAQDMLFSCKLPQMDKMERPGLAYEAHDKKGTHILLDGVQDPGNVGAVIRTANAFGIGSVILTGECADPYNPKAIRASMGAIFRQQIYYMTLPELTELKDNGAVFIGAALREDSRDVRDADLSSAIIAIGGEGRGLSEEVLDLCDDRVMIPISPDCESLNAAIAASIIMWETRRSCAGSRK